MSLIERGSARPDVDYDVIIVGAGLSGIGAAYRLQESHPHRSYAILEGREAIGGTWDLFRYPGVRSDSDMYTLGYPFRPWTNRKSIADGETIREYVTDTAAENGIDKHIQFQTKVQSAQWSSADERWTLTVTRTDGEQARTEELTAAFVFMCSGYYNYEHPYEPVFEGIEDFAGQVVHPQFWPEDLDYAGKKVVVIGSGATAVTVVPAMTDRAEHVTMLQRTPTYFTVLPEEDPIAKRLRSLLPEKLAYKIIRGKNVALTSAFYQLCRRRPKVAKKLLQSQVTHFLKDAKQTEQHFNPPYQPWDQRLCVVPDADFFRAVRSGKASVVTDHIERFVPKGIKLRSGKVLEADIVVTATGLALQMVGGVDISVDGSPVDASETWLYRGVLLSGVPNLAICIGYVNASWTLRSDLTARYVARLLTYLDQNGYSVATPTAPTSQDEQPLLPLDSGYIARSAALMPKLGTADPWLMPQNYLRDAASMRTADVTRSMSFGRRARKTAAAPEYESSSV